MKLTTQQNLVLKSAILDPEQASLKWKELLSHTPFDELDGSSYRVVSAVYKNLETVPDIPDFDRLKGSYRFNWARNSKLISDVVPVLRDFEKENVDYRLLKGAAINLINSSLGIRTMGDIDLLISADSLALATKILEKHTFTKKYDTRCNTSTNGLIDFELCYINANGVEVDVHVAERKFPRNLFTKILKSEPMIIRHMGLDLRIPSYELALIHTVIHGDLNVSDSDRMQSLIDCSQLMKIVDKKKLRKLCQNLDVNFLMVDYLNTVNSINGINQSSSNLWNLNFIKRLGKIHFIVSNRVLERSKLREVIQARRIFPRELKYLRKHFCGRRNLYFLWSKFGQLRIVERIVSMTLKGFLYSPNSNVKPGTTSRIFFESPNSWFEASTVPAESNDWRFKLKFDGESSAVIVQMFSDRFLDWNWIVFVNGKLAGTTPQNEDGVYSIFLKKPKGTFEISLRSPTHVCMLCYRDMSDLRVHIL